MSDSWISLGTPIFDDEVDNYDVSALGSPISMVDSQYLDEVDFDSTVDGDNDSEHRLEDNINEKIEYGTGNEFYDEKERTDRQLRASLSTFLNVAAAVKPPTSPSYSHVPAGLPNVCRMESIEGLHITEFPSAIERKKRRRLQDRTLISRSMLIGVVLVAFSAGYVVGRQSRKLTYLH